jgi:cellulose synthase (UDP-forming)
VSEVELEAEHLTRRARWGSAFQDRLNRWTQGFQEWMDRFTDSVLDRPRRVWLLVLICLMPMITLVMVDLPARAHVVLSCVLVAAGLVVARRAPSWRLVVVFLSLVASFRYMLYRGTETLSLHTTGDTVVSLLLYGAELFALVTLVGGYFQTAITRRNTPPEITIPDSQLPTVDIFIPTYNEGLDVLGPTVLGALAINYPHKKIWVLDDGKRPEVEAMARRLGVGYFTRPDNRGAKAGNVNAALARTDSELIAFFDADHVPVQGFLRQTVGFFLKNKNLALVQTPHHFYNPDPFLRNLHMEGRVPPEQHLFYHGIQLGNDFWNSAFFCGSCALISRKALDEVGGLSQQTVTEDAHTALQMHARGWDSVFLDIPLAAGLATETFAFHVGQRIRWARGMAQIFRTDNPLLKRGLSLAQRINYFNAAWHFFAGLPRLIFLVIPPIYLLWDLHPVDADVREVLVYAIPHLLLEGLGAATMHRNVRHSIWPEVYEVAIAPYTALVTSMALIFPRWGRFNVTTKGSQLEKRTFDVRNTSPHLILMGLILAGMAALPGKLYDQPLNHETILIAAGWNLYNVIILMAAIAAGLERPQRRAHHRIEREARIVAGRRPRQVLGVDGLVPMTGRSSDLSMGGLSFRLEGAHKIPERIFIQIQSDVGKSTILEIEVVTSFPEGDTTVVRGRFERLTPEQEGDLSRQIFSVDDAWLHDEFTYDSPGRSALIVVLAPMSALLGNPAWMRKLTHGQSQPRASLVPADRVSKLHPTRLGLAPMLTPVALVSISIGLAVGWSPMVRAFSSYLPISEWEQVTYQTRLSQLTQAYYQLRDLQSDMRNSYRTDSDLPADWNERLFTVRRDYSIHGIGGGRAESADIEQALSAAVLSMISAQEEFEDGADRKTLSARLDSVDQNLNRAAKKLGIAP